MTNTLETNRRQFSFIPTELKKTHLKRAFSMKLKKKNHKCIQPHFFQVYFCVKTYT